MMTSSIAVEHYFLSVRCEELDAALEVEDRHLGSVIEEFMQWLRDGGLHLGADAEEGKGLRET